MVFLTNLIVIISGGTSGLEKVKCSTKHGGCVCKIIFLVFKDSSVGGWGGVALWVLLRQNYGSWEGRYIF